MNYMRDCAEEDLFGEKEINLIKGKKTIAKESEMTIMTSILNKSGWIDKLQDSLSMLPEAWPSIEHKIASYWTNILKVEKEQRLNNKKQLGA